MKPAETKALYEKACHVRRLTLQQEEAAEWHKILKAHELRDAEAAIRAWWASSAVDDKGELRSKWLPTPAELRKGVEHALAERASLAREPEDIVGWECANHHRAIGFYRRSQPTPSGKKCACGAEFHLLRREAS